jgi:hypothetical protein
MGSAAHKSCEPIGCVPTLVNSVLYFIAFCLPRRHPAIGDHRKAKRER